MANIPKDQISINLIQEITKIFKRKMITRDKTEIMQIIKKNSATMKKENLNIDNKIIGKLFHFLIKLSSYKIWIYINLT